MKPFLFHVILFVIEFRFEFVVILIIHLFPLPHTTLFISDRVVFPQFLTFSVGNRCGICFFYYLPHLEYYFMKVIKVFSPLLFVFFLTACSPIGEKNTDLSYIYGASAVLSLLILVAYCFFTKKKTPWFLLLFSSVLVVNLGYFSLSISKTLEEALLANRISYLGSVFLPYATLMLLLDLIIFFQIT